MSDNKFSLRSKDFETNMTKALKDLREENNLFDVTIVCEDSQIQAHKLILSACSTFFRNILCHNPHQHPLLYLKDVKYKHFLAIIDFMYNGEVHVVQEELKQFLAVAADLRVQGLTQKTPMITSELTGMTKKCLTNCSPIANKSYDHKRNFAEGESAIKRPRTTQTSSVKTVQNQQPLSTEILEVAPDPPTPPQVKHLLDSSFTTTDRMDTAAVGEKILEQCISQAGIETGMADSTQIRVGYETEKDPGSPKSFGTMEDVTYEEVKSISKVECLKQKNSNVSQQKQDLSPHKKRSRKSARTPGSQSKPPSLDLSFIERFATVWRCKICQKISSNKFMALDHREEAHAVAMQLK